RTRKKTGSDITNSFQPMHSVNLRITRGKTGVVVVDMQERLLPAIFERERVIHHVALLARAAAILGLPVFATEQYRKGLGPTVPEVAAPFSQFAPVEKTAFSVCGAPGFVAALKARGLSDVVLCGR